MKNKKIYITAAAVSLVFLILISSAIFVLSIRLNEARSNASKADKEFVYVYAEDSNTEESSDIIQKWTVKEYNGRIGIYNEQGVLLEVIETYIKTLPISEREQLKEGIEVFSKDALYSIIEDYTD